MTPSVSLYLGHKPTPFVQVYDYSETMIYVFAETKKAVLRLGNFNQMLRISPGEVQLKFFSFHF